MAFSLALTQATYVVIFLSDKVAKGHYEYVPAGAISEALGIPKPSVVKILKGLAQEGLVVTGAGVTGGARLSPGALERSLWDLFIAIEGRHSLFREYHDFPAQGSRPDEARQRVTTTWAAVEQQWAASLKGVSLRGLVG